MDATTLSVGAVDAGSMDATTLSVGAVDAGSMEATTLSGIARGTAETAEIVE